MNLLKKLFTRKKKLYGAKPNEKVFIKKIWSWRRKSQEQIYDVLQIEVEHLLRIHTGYKLKGFSKPYYCHDTSIFYRIILKKK